MKQELNQLLGKKKGRSFLIMLISLLFNSDAVKSFRPPSHLANCTTPNSVPFAGVSTLHGAQTAHVRDPGTVGRDRASA